jgi:PKD repeat protein
MVHGNVLAVLAVLIAVGAVSVSVAAADPAPRVMQGTDEQLRAWIAQYEAAPTVAVAPLRARTDAATAGSKSLLDLVPYNATERSQCPVSNCWVWTGTGILEAALSVQNGVRDRLSVQYFDSNYNGGAGASWAGNGGSLGAFVQFYSTQRIAVPWSNPNASFQDGRTWCAANRQAWVPAGSVGTDPHYDILSIEAQRVETRGIGDAAARANIKGLLQTNRPAYLAMRLPDREAWSAFYTFWNTAPETAVFNLSAYNGRAWTSLGGGHAVLVVGYDETDPANPYWTVLNSWGTADGNRPHGTFRISMNMPYDGLYQGSFTVPSTEWQTVAVRFTAPTTPTPTAAPRLTASFSIAPTPACAGQPVRFTDASTGLPTGHLWTFGDGASSTEQHPSHTYARTGSFRVTHKITKDGRSSSATKTLVVGPSAPVASFTSRTTTAPRTLQFVDTSTGAPTAYRWTFGDGGTSSLKNPVHAYAKPGTYTICLTVNRAGSPASTVKSTVRVSR